MFKMYLIQVRQLEFPVLHHCKYFQPSATPATIDNIVKFSLCVIVLITTCLHILIALVLYFKVQSDQNPYKCSCNANH